MKDKEGIKQVVEEDDDVGDTIVVDVDHICNENCEIFRWIQAGVEREAEEARIRHELDEDIDDSASDRAWKDWEETGVFPELTPPEEDTRSECSDRIWS